MLRHSRAMTRHHRQRIINKRYHIWWMKKLYDEAENAPRPGVKYGKRWLHRGYLNKLSMHHHKCEYCTQEYKRLAPGQDKFMEEYANE